MPQQRDLIEPPPLTITPVEGMTEPRLWVRRLVAWKEPAGEVIRDIALRPGLNIIWSPDRAEDALGGDGSIGHGGGKTLFCRLLRYCLGEDRFATEDQREWIRVAFPNGIVGAEIIVNGTCWAIIRPLGLRRRHMAVPNGDLEEIAAGDGASTGIDPFIAAVDEEIITTGIADLVRPGTGGALWPVALAWLTRDQECRFDDVLEWRAPAAGSDSPLPASGREKGPRLEALRALLKAMTPEEGKARVNTVFLEEERRSLEIEIGHRRWSIADMQTRLIGALGLADHNLSEMPLLLDVMRKAAETRVAEAASIPDDGPSTLLEARRALDEARAECSRIDGERIRIEALIPITERLISQIRGELPALSYSTAEAESPVCPICEVPIDRALAEGCKVSHKLPDAAACRARWERRQKDLRRETEELNELQERRLLNQQQLALAEQNLRQCDDRVSRLEGSRDRRESAWYAARRLQDEVEHLRGLMAAQELDKSKLSDVGRELETGRKRLSAFRDKQARIFGRMTEKFDPIIRELVGQDAKSRITLSGNGLELSVDIGGDRTTAAIDSLKVLAFDLTVLCLSTEGATHVPGFLIHDSPREADLGLSIYHRLFRFVRRIEGEHERALFQYIVTTTTRPPSDLAVDPWLRLTLRGSPGSERLLRADLSGAA